MKTSYLDSNLFFFCQSLGLKLLNMTILYALLNLYEQMFD